MAKIIKEEYMDSGFKEWLDINYGVEPSDLSTVEYIDMWHEWNDEVSIMWQDEEDIRDICRLKEIEDIQTHIVRDLEDISCRLKRIEERYGDL